MAECRLECFSPAGPEAFQFRLLLSLPTWLCPTGRTVTPSPRAIIITLALSRRKRLRFFLVTVLLLPLVAALTGCPGGRPAVANVSGKVAYKGQALGGGTLTLHSAKGGSYPFSISKEGTFTGEIPLNAVGQMTVTVETDSVKGFAAGAAGYPLGMAPKGTTAPEIDKSSMPTYVQIPAKYKDAKASGLTWDIRAGNNE